MMVINITTLKNKALELGCEVKENVSMKDYTTFKTGGNCQLLISPNSIGALSEIVKECNKSDIPYTVLGNGSNVLVSDDGLKGIVIYIAEGLSEIRLLNDTTIYCEAGVKLGTLCNFALENSLSGLEFAFGIPGSVGGAVFMNAGAYNGEMKNIITKVYHIDNNGDEGYFTDEQLGFDYRTSAYEKNGYIITGTEITLEKGSQTEIKEKMTDLLGRRKDKQPLDYPSAGSTFKRPAEGFAGAFIEQCGLKGKQIGGAMVSEKHAGFIINYNNATSSDILKLMDYVTETVKKEKGVTLTPEVRFLR